MGAAVRGIRSRSFWAQKGRCPARAIGSNTRARLPARALKALVREHRAEALGLGGLKPDIAIAVEFISIAVLIVRAAEA